MGESATMIYHCASVVQPFTQGNHPGFNFTLWEPELETGVYPPAMWLGGGLNPEQWFKHKTKEGQIIEGSVRDEGKPQGTVLVGVTTSRSKPDWDNLGNFPFPT
jgi:hypothetical protein